jgi:hypothetical protein
MIEDLKTDSEMWEAERRASMPGMFPATKSHKNGTIA